MFCQGNMFIPNSFIFVIDVSYREGTSELGNMVFS